MWMAILSIICQIVDFSSLSHCFPLKNWFEVRVSLFLLHFSSAIKTESADAVELPEVFILRPTETPLEYACRNATILFSLGIRGRYWMTARIEICIMCPGTVIKKQTQHHSWCDCGFQTFHNRIQRHVKSAFKKKTNTALHLHLSLSAADTLIGFLQRLYTRLLCLPVLSHPL